MFFKQQSLNGNVQPYGVYKFMESENCQLYHGTHVNKTCQNNEFSCFFLFLPFKVLPKKNF